MFLNHFWRHKTLIRLIEKEGYRHINLPMFTSSSVWLTSSTVFDLRILYFEGCLIRILIKNSQKGIMLNLVFFFLDSSNEVAKVLVDRKRLNWKIRFRKGTFKWVIFWCFFKSHFWRYKTVIRLIEIGGFFILWSHRIYKMCEKIIYPFPYPVLPPVICNMIFFKILNSTNLCVIIIQVCRPSCLVMCIYYLFMLNWQILCTTVLYGFMGNKESRNGTKRNETRHNRNETKPKKSSVTKKTKQTFTKRIFLHETTIHKMQVAACFVSFRFVSVSFFVLLPPNKMMLFHLCYYYSSL
jgi:hypothetical protein